MKWEVTGADRNSGEEKTVIIEADNEESARRRGNRAGLMVSGCRAIDNDDSVSGVTAPAAVPYQPANVKRAVSSSSPSPQAAAVVHGVAAISAGQSAPLKNGWGIASVILAAIAFVIALVPCIGLIGAIPLGLIGGIFGVVGLIIGYSYGRPVIASWIGAVGSLAAIVLALAITSALGSGIAAASKQAQAAQQAAQAAQAQQRAAMRDTVAVYTADQVVNYYANNEVAGDNALKGKMLKVEGDVDRVGKDMLNNAYVSLQHAPGTFRSVQCFFNDPSQIGSLSSGSHAVIYGRCDGLMGNVLIKDCEIISK